MTLSHKITTTLHEARTSGVLHVIYALLAETLFIGLLCFAALFTIETLLPTFVTIRFSITGFFLVLVLLAMGTALLGRFIDISFPATLEKRNPFVILGLLWALGILTVSLVKFPLPAIVAIIVLLFLSGYLFSKILTEEK